jgi:hypothetical protein
VESHPCPINPHPESPPKSHPSAPMARLSARSCETARPDKSGQDRLLGDGDGLFLRIRPQGTKTWVIEYEFERRRRKYTIGVFDSAGAPGESITAWLEHGRLSLSQARSIAAQWKADRRARRDPVIEWQARLTQKRAAEEEARHAREIDSRHPTMRQAADQFLAKHMNGKKSADAIRYRLDRLVALIGEKKLRDVSRQDVIAAIDRIAEGQKEGKTAKQLAGEVLSAAKRLWRFAEARQWVSASCVAPLTRADFDARPRKGAVTRVPDAG